VPHRSEYTDTHGFALRGPNRSLLYIPDIDKWERWDRPIEEVVKITSAALLDGTFFADGEIPGRSMADIPHPFITESLRRFAALPESERDDPTVYPPADVLARCEIAAYQGERPIQFYERLWQRVHPVS